MGLTNKSNLKSQADLIRYEDSEGQNTAERVGKMLVDIIEATDSALTTEAQQRESKDNALQTTLNSTTIIAGNANTTANEAKAAAANAAALAGTAKTAADKAQTTADEAKTQAVATHNSIGQPNGIAPLDANAKVPAANLPGFVDDVIEFNAMVSGVTSQRASIGKSSTDRGCMVVYDTVANRFLLAVSNLQVSENGDWDAVLRPKRVTAISPKIEAATPSILIDDFWNIDKGEVAIKIEVFTYYNNWLDAESFGEGVDIDGRIPDAGKIYTCTSNNKTFRWSGSELITIGSDLALGETAGTAYPGDKGKAAYDQAIENRNRLSDHSHQLMATMFLNLNALYDTDEPFYTLKSAVSSVDDSYRIYGAVVTFLMAETNANGEEKYKWVAYQWVKNVFDEDADWENPEQWKPFGGGGAAVGNTFNATVEIPLPAGEYYSDIMAETQTHNVLDAVFAADKALLGLQITFAISAGSWKTYQYVGPNVTEAQFKSAKNWIDLAGMSAGAEAIINVDNLCPRTVSGYYTKDSAIDAILSIQQSSGITYAKGGLVITFRSEEYKWEAYQFTGQPTDFASKELWKEFGGGGSVKTSDTPERGGHDAFSTGGAYELEQKQFAGLEIVPDPDNYVIQGVDKAGAKIGESVSIPKSNGAGQVAGSTLSIYLESPAVYAAYGSEISVRAAIKSVTFDGDTEVLGVIRRLEIIDTTSGLTLWSENVNQNSSATSTDYKFTLEFTKFFTEAAQKEFTIVAYDADNNVKRRTITVTAVDVTCTSVQTLNYTSSSALEVGGDTKNILMYKFANNVSKQGVKVTTEIYLNGAWHTLGVATITDSYSHTISINPKNVLGGNEVMQHGSYPIRISGEDVASGVKGNTIYSSVMCVDPASTTPIVALRYNDTNNGSIRLYDSLVVEVAAYTPNKNSTKADVSIDGHVVTTVECQISQTYQVSKQIQGYDTDGSATIEFFVQSGASQTTPIQIRVYGSAIAAVLKEGALFGYDFATRSNSEPDHTITDKGYTMIVEGSNWSSNGFGNYLGDNCLRIAENVTARIPYAPFGSAATERTNGMAWQMAFATNNIKDSEAKLVECYDPDSGAGFYICGNKVVMYCKNGTPSTVTRGFKCGEKITLAVVVEPSTITVHRGSTDYSTLKLYLNGEEVGAIGYVANSGAILNTRHISFNGTDGDLYLYYVLAYDSYYEWAQAFQNYLCKLTDTNAMTAEYEAENVLDNQNRPTLDLLKAKGIPYYVVVAPQATFDSFDSDINTSTNFKCTLFYFHPTMPWRSFKAENVRWRRQGTTSAKRPIKNDRFYLAKEKGWKITPIYPDYENADALMAYKLFELGYVRVEENTIPVKIITVKVDYSDSSNSNDCGVCDLMNATYRTLGASYMTPAQRAFDGTWNKGEVVVSGLEMNHSTANHPIAAFRATNESLTDAWFHAKGNWKEDKGEQVALGFMDTPGYNKGCLNYGDFIEFFGLPDETLDQTMARFKQSEGLDTTMPYLLSQYCGRDYRIMRYSGGEWARSTGSMKQINGKWVITGDVLNPVSGYELITYDGMDWFMGVGSVADMMAPTATMSSWVAKLNLGQETYPAWTQFFECMIDDDQLQIDLAMGRKVPYDLFNVLKFCDTCDYSKAALASTWQGIWKSNAWKYMSVQSLISYYTFTDYLAAVDQQAKNMQPMFFLEDGCWVENGEYHTPSAMEPVRMYFNKVYDCDTCNGKDNDGGNTIPSELDPATDDKCYAGRGSILWNDLRRCENQEMVCDASGNTLTLPGVVATMRNLPEIDGIGAGPFSPKGALHYFVNKRMKLWPKVVSSYDGERKYIHYTGYNDIYYYALQGLGLTSLPAFIEQRWRIRDGYYQTGDFKDASHVLGGRVGAKTGAVIRFKAAKSGYFGIGNDGGNITQGMYLQAGEEGVFTDFQHGDNILLYIYQADRMSEIDLSQLSLDPNFQFSVMTLAEKIVIGSVNHRTTWRLSPGNTGFLETMNLGDLPFLRHLDVRTTEIRSINASKCPRLETVLASGSDLTSITTAETSPLETLELPASMSELNFVNLPKLSYPGGLTIAGMSNVIRLMLSGCPHIDPMALINGIVTSSAIRYIRLPDVNITAPSSILAALRSSGAVGLDPSGQAYEESGQCSGITGRWIMENLIPENGADAVTIEKLKRYFPQLEIHNSQYTGVVFDDTESDSQNITNLENGTVGEEFEPSGHFVRVRDMSHAYKCTYNRTSQKMRCIQISDANYNLMADGTEYDPTDQAGEGFDIMKLLPAYWYKGVNDYKNQRKYFFVSSMAEEPISTVATNADGSYRRNRVKLADCLHTSMASVYTIVDDTAVKKGDDVTILENPNYSVYEINVEGMKQVRWPGLNNATIGAVFVDADGKIVAKFNMMVTHALFDFVNGEYVFCDVPSGSVKLLFTAPIGFDELEAIAVDSAAIEAIEPDWVHTRQRLVGVYGIHMDNLMRPRSISGSRTKCGDGTSTTNPDWQYDSEGRVKNTSVPTSTMHYTCQDFMNLCEMRGEGYHAIDYEISKDIANLVMALTGERDIQAYAGYGCGSQYTTGANNFNTFGNVTRKYSGSNIGNIIFGIQNFVACNYEWMSNIAANVTSYASFKKNKCIGQSSDPIDAVYHIYDPVSKTERAVQGLNNTSSGYCIGRVKFGRFCDTLASRVTSDSSQWNLHYGDGYYYTHDRGRVVGRASGSAHAYGGLVFSSAHSVSTFSYTGVGSRLAFSGDIEIVEDTSETIETD